MAQPPGDKFADLPRQKVPAESRLTPSEPVAAQLGQSRNFTAPPGGVTPTTATGRFEEFLKVDDMVVNIWTVTLQTVTIVPPTNLVVPQLFVVRIRYGNGGTQHEKYIRLYPDNIKTVVITAASVAVDVMSGLGFSAEFQLRASISKGGDTAHRSTPSANPLIPTQVYAPFGNYTIDRGFFLPPCEVFVEAVESDATYTLRGFSGRAGTGTPIWSREILAGAFAVNTPFGIPVSVAPSTLSIALDSLAGVPFAATVFARDFDECGFFP